MKGDQVVVFLSEPDFYDIGDKLSIKDEKGDTVGTASLLKIRENKGMVTFTGVAKKGYEIFKKKSWIKSYNPDRNFKTMSKARYITGGVVGTFLSVGIVFPLLMGFSNFDKYISIIFNKYTNIPAVSVLFLSTGIGHYIQGRYKTGLTFFASQLIISVIVLTPFVIAGNWALLAIPFVGGPMLIGFKVSEIISLWRLPKRSFKPMSKARYITGGILGTLLPFGIGHYIQGKYKTGLIFTTGQLLSVSAIALLPHLDIINSYLQASFWIAAITIFGAFKISEIVSVWSSSSESYKIVSGQQKVHDFFSEKSRLNTILKKTPKLQFAFRFK